MQSKVDFLVVGAQKAGTSTLHHILKQHPQIFLPESKELHFFDKTKNPQQHLKEYLDHFSNALKSEIKGEITPDYLFYGHVPETIKSLLGQVKIIIVLRNPATRSISQFNFHRMHNVEKMTDYQEIFASEQVDTNVRKFDKWYDPPYYVSRSMYADQINRYLEHFGKENVHVMIFENFVGKNYKNELQQLLRFLNVDENFIPKIENTHPTKIKRNVIVYNFLRAGRWIKRVIGESTYLSVRKYVLNLIRKDPKSTAQDEILKINKTYFMEDIHKLERMLSIDLSQWYGQ